MKGFSKTFPVNIAELWLFVGADDRDCEKMDVFRLAVGDSCSGALLPFTVVKPTVDPGFVSLRVCSWTLLQSIPSSKGAYLMLPSGISAVGRGEECCNSGSYSSADLELPLHVCRTLDGGC